MKASVRKSGGSCNAWGLFDSPAASEPDGPRHSGGELQVVRAKERPPENKVENLLTMMTASLGAEASHYVDIASYFDVEGERSRGSLTKLKSYVRRSF